VRRRRIRATITAQRVVMRNLLRIAPDLIDCQCRQWSHSFKEDVGSAVDSKIIFDDR
jgi:hypothetical protein